MRENNFNSKESLISYVQQSKDKIDIDQLYELVRFVQAEVEKLTIRNQSKTRGLNEIKAKVELTAVPDDIIVPSVTTNVIPSVKSIGGALKVNGRVISDNGIMSSDFKSGLTSNSKGFYLGEAVPSPTTLLEVDTIRVRKNIIGGPNLFQAARAINGNLFVSSTGKVKFTYSGYIKKIFIGKDITDYIEEINNVSCLTISLPTDISAAQPYLIAWQIDKLKKDEVVYISLVNEDGKLFYIYTGNDYKISKDILGQETLYTTIYITQPKDLPLNLNFDKYKLRINYNDWNSVVYAEIDNFLIPDPVVVPPVVGKKPLISKPIFSNITNTNVILNASVCANEENTSITYEFGETISYGKVYTPYNAIVTGSSYTVTSIVLTNLIASTTYHFRVKAVNKIGTTYSPDITFMTTAVPIVILSSNSFIFNTAPDDLSIPDTQNLTITTTNPWTLVVNNNVTWLDVNPKSGTAGTKTITVGVTDLTLGVSTHTASFTITSVSASNSPQIVNISYIIANTAIAAPLVDTAHATNITSTTATFNGSVIANSASTDVSFEYGINNTYGTTISAIPSPVTGCVVTNVSANVTDLLENTLYHYHCVATNIEGTTEGFYDYIFTTTKQPEITLSCSELEYSSYLAETNSITQTFNISNTGGETLDWIITKDVSWLSLSSESGTGDAIITVGIISTMLPEENIGTITISSDNATNGPLTITVTHRIMLRPIDKYATSISSYSADSLMVKNADKTLATDNEILLSKNWYMVLTATTDITQFGTLIPNGTEWNLFNCDDITMPLILTTWYTTGDNWVGTLLSFDDDNNSLYQYVAPYIYTDFTNLFKTYALTIRVPNAILNYNTSDAAIWVAERGSIDYKCWWPTPDTKIKYSLFGIKYRHYFNKINNEKVYTNYSTMIYFKIINDISRDNAAWQYKPWWITTFKKTYSFWWETNDPVNGILINTLGTLPPGVTTVVNKNLT